MSLNSIIQVIIKILGLLVLKDIFMLIAGSVETFYQYGQFGQETLNPFVGKHGSEDFTGTLFRNYGVYLIFYLLWFYLLVFHTRAIANFITKDPGLGQQVVNIKINVSTILMAVLFFVGFELILTALKSLFSSAVEFFDAPIELRRNFHFSGIIKSAINILIGIVLIANMRNISGFFLKMARKTSASA